MQGEDIVFTKDTMVKSGDPELMRIEVEKTNRAFKIGIETGLFSVPEVIDFKETEGVVVFRRIPNLKPVRDLIAFKKNTELLVRSIGHSLAAVHGNLKLPDSMLNQMGTGLASTSDSVFIHGDFSLDNVCVTADSETLFIVDWQMTALCGGQATYGPRYFDISWFLVNLFAMPSKSIKYFVASRPAQEPASNFIAAYAEMAESFDWNEAAGYLERLSNHLAPIRRQTWSPKRRIAMLPSRIRYRKFIESIRRKTTQSHLNRC